MALPSSGQISMLDIYMEKTGFSSGRRSDDDTDFSLTGFSVDGTTVNLGGSNHARDFIHDGDINEFRDGTPNGTAPYAMSEFHGWSRVFTTFNTRGSNTSTVSVGIKSDASSEAYNNFPQSATAEAIFYIYYNPTQTDIKIHAVPNANGTDYASDSYYNSSGTLTSLGTSATSHPPAPGVVINGIGSGYQCACEITGGSTTGYGIHVFTVNKTGFNTFSNSSGTWTHSGTATIPVQTTTQQNAETATGSAPQGLRVTGEVEVETAPYFNPGIVISQGSSNPVFKFTFTKSGSPTYYVYMKADLDAIAQNIF